MQVADLIGPDRVITGLRPADKVQLLQDLSRRAAKALGIDARTIIDALDQREALGSTGIGQGIAIPHAQIAGLQHAFGLFARLDRPIDFAAIDERPVDLVCLVLVPRDAGSEHLAALACVARRLRDPDVARDLRASRDADTVRARLTGLDTIPTKQA